MFSRKHFSISSTARCSLRPCVLWVRDLCPNVRKLGYSAYLLDRLRLLVVSDGPVVERPIIIPFQEPEAWASRRCRHRILENRFLFDAQRTRKNNSSSNTSHHLSRSIYFPLTKIIWYYPLYFTFPNSHPRRLVGIFKKKLDIPGSTIKLE